MAHLIFKEEIPIEDQIELMKRFNEELNRGRSKYLSFFLTNFRDNNRKRISFELVYKFLNYIYDEKIQNNLHYFKISWQNPERILDSFYVFDEKHPQLQKYIANTKEIKNILITIRTLQKKNEDKKVIKKYFLELSKTLGKFSNCSEFACFINACDSFLDLAKQDILLLEKLPRDILRKEF